MRGVVEFMPKGVRCPYCIIPIWVNSQADLIKHIKARHRNMS
jgi:DNA-directed RNA polymerase subunit RPC12/RpoP